MKNINRREYLSRMGMAAVGTLAVAELKPQTPRPEQFTRKRLNLNETESSIETKAIAPAQAGAVHWPTTQRKPGNTNPGIRLIFVGMSAYTYKGAEGRVVFHRGAEHNLQIVVLESCREIFSIGGGVKPIQINEMEIAVQNKPNDVAYFYGTDFDRAQNIGDDKDFRWLLDLESYPFHAGKLNRTDDKFSTKLKVGHGTFYTYQHTNSTFKVRGGDNNGTPLGHVAKIMAADIPVAANECAWFTINKQNLLPPFCYGQAYEIYFLNYCEACAVSDFEMVFDAIDDDSIRPFGLELVDKGKNECPTGLCLTQECRSEHKPSPTRGPHTEASRVITSLEHIFLNDEAPCMGGGLGGGHGFP